jgi:hypothetical protein
MTRDGHCVVVRLFFVGCAQKNVLAMTNLPFRTVVVVKGRLSLRWRCFLLGNSIPYRLPFQTTKGMFQPTLPHHHHSCKDLFTPHLESISFFLSMLTNTRSGVH